MPPLSIPDTKSLGSRAFPPRDLVRRWIKRAVVLCLSTAVAAGGYAGYLHLSGNFHTIIEGAVYRSGQPSPDRLTAYINQHGIRSVINLRGESPGRGWYDEELAVAKDNGVKHYSFKMSARKRLDQDRARELIELMAKAEKPVLIHCQGGADRTGLAAALYLAAIAKTGEEEAEDQISFRYGHVSLPMTTAYPMDESFEALEPWLGFQDS